jgi:DNA-binding NarL/FixJ family response regulator
VNAGSAIDMGVVIVEDHALLSHTLRLALSAEGLDVVVAPTDDRPSLLATVGGARRQLVLLDLDLGEGLGDGIDLMPELNARGALVLVVTGAHERRRWARALEAGAIGVVLKDQPFETLVDTALRAARGETVLDPAFRRELLVELRHWRAERDRRLAPFRSLTAREQQVLEEILHGHPVETIAQKWVVSPATVRSQVRGVLTKLDVTSQLAAAAKARSAGWRCRG